MIHASLTFLPTALEYCGVSRRTIPLLVMMSSYTLASVTVPFIAAALPTWRHLLALACLPNLAVLAAFRVLPESPSWLLCKGEAERARQQLRTVGSVNGRGGKVRITFRVNPGFKKKSLTISFLVSNFNFHKILVILISI